LRIFLVSVRGNDVLNSVEQTAPCHFVAGSKSLLGVFQQRLDMRCLGRVIEVTVPPSPVKVSLSEYSDTFFKFKPIFDPP